MNSPTQYIEAQTHHQAQIKHFHKQHKLSQPQQTDRLFCFFHHNALHGVARCVPIHQAWWLRGLFITPEYRSQQHATRLINHLTSQLDQSVLAFIQPQLASFYSPLGFVAYDSCELTGDQLTLFQRYQKTKPQLQAWLYTKN